MQWSIAYSPCPNDTFMFHAIAAGDVRLDGHSFEVHVHDVETLNRRALQGVYDVSKISFHAWLFARESYALLESGAALGFGCGPLVVATRPLERAALKDARVAVPGELTTAHLLWRLWAPPGGQRLFVPYQDILPMVADGRADVGLVIHEGRFVYQRYGLQCLLDLGDWWESATRLPLPLGCVVARRALGDDTLRAFEGLLRQSIALAGARPEAALAYARQHAQELDEDVLRRHIRTFVTDYSLELGARGRAAVAELERRARDAGVIP